MPVSRTPLCVGVDTPFYRLGNPLPKAWSLLSISSETPFWVVKGTFRARKRIFRRLGIPLLEARIPLSEGSKAPCRRLGIPFPGAERGLPGTRNPLARGSEPPFQKRKRASPKRKKMILARKEAGRGRKRNSPDLGTPSPTDTGGLPGYRLL
jgi:hypothetical protein